MGGLLMATFYACWESLLYRGALRWGCLGMGAMALSVNQVILVTLGIGRSGHAWLPILGFV